MHTDTPRRFGHENDTRTIYLLFVTNCTATGLPVYTIKWCNFLSQLCQILTDFHNISLFTKTTNLFSSHPRGNVRTSSLARWKARSQLPIRDK